MRMKGKILTESAVHQFTRVVHTVSRINKEGVLRWAPTKLYFVLTARDIADGDVKVWSEMNTNLVFDSFLIESKHENNEILMEISLDNLLRALKSAQSASQVTVRMTKKNGMPFLTLDISVMGAHNNQRTIVQDVPIVVLRHELSVEYQEPNLPHPEVNIFLPSLKVLRGIIDRMKTLSKHLTLAANGEGELHLSIEADMVSVRTVIRDLENPTYQDEQSQGGARAGSEFVSARIDISKFSQFLYGDQIMPTNVICSIVENRAVILFLLNSDVSLTYYVPVIL
eukprot:comp101594_c0_seq1/m.48740 comp101594_c0_seq1/g.48740  ORF comp101594_c0_seq1/g.48740 comp101594_c0_seq1/m.48740 type:complete len:283 (-) comp101594_c0_seq1:191-1039(-)